MQDKKQITVVYVNPVDYLTSSRFHLSLTMSLKWGATVVKPIIGVVLIFSKRFSTELNV